MTAAYPHDGATVVPTFTSRYPLPAYPDAGEYLRWTLAHREAFARGYRRVQLGNPVTAAVYTAESFQRDWRRALNRRISVRGGLMGTGRKWDPECAALDKDVRRALFPTPAEG